MSSLPLLGHASLDDVLAWRPSGPVGVRQFLADVEALAAQLPAGRNFLNVCQDRYRFTVGLAAGLIGGRTSLQPAAQSAETLRQVAAAYPDVFCLCDGDFASGDLPRFAFPELAAVDPEIPVKIPEIAADHVAACLFTSGSTGLPMPHHRTWGAMVRSARAEAGRLGLFARRHAIVGTIPAQHSYGFESTVLLALQGNSPFWSGKPFYPQDIVAALAALPRPRMLVTTPFHLSAVLAAGLDLPAVDLLLSATAPLSARLAAEAERRFAAPLHEIYGCTEAGQIASRRTTAGDPWRLLAGVRLEQDGERTTACGGHVEGRVVLSDQLGILGDGTFLLHGRHADQVNIAGKRSSLAYLNHQIAALPGVVDAVFFLPDDATADGVGRPCAFVVAPGGERRQLLAALRERIDPAFLPRPLILVDELPRNATGKLPRERLLALYAAHKSDAVR